MAMRDPLLLAARELVGIAAAELVGARQVHAGQRGVDGARRGPARPVGVEHRGDRAPDADRGVERRPRVLRHVGDDAAAQPTGGALVAQVDALPRDHDLAAGDAQPRPRRSRAGPGRRRLAAPRLAHQPEDLAALDAQRDVLDHRRRRRAARPAGRPPPAPARRSPAASTDDRPSVRATESPTRLRAIVSSAISAAGREDHPRVEREAVAVLGDHQRPIGRRRLQAEAEEVDRRGEDDRVREAAGRRRPSRPARRWGRSRARGSTPSAPRARRPPRRSREPTAPAWQCARRAR